MRGLSSTGRRSLIFYLAADNSLISVSIQSGAAPEPGVPVPLFQGRYYFGQTTGAVWRASVGRTWDVSPDGKRFLMIRPGDGADQVVTVVNFVEELKRLVPTR